MNLLRRLFLGYKSDSGSLVKHLKRVGCKIGEDVEFFSPNHAFVDETRPWLIEIGSHVRFARGVTILTHDFGWFVLKRMTGDVLGSSGKVVIGSNVFIGMNTTILKGVKIGNNCIVGANSLVSKDVPDGYVVAGNPARTICSIEEYGRKRTAAQESEAVQLVMEYFKTYGKMPRRRELREFLWLFDERRGDTVEDGIFREIASIGGNYELSKKRFLGSAGKFDSYDDFLNYCYSEIHRKGGDKG